MQPNAVAEVSWAERAADRSPIVRRSRNRGVEQAKAIVQAARRLIDVQGPTFTTQELVREAGIALQTFYRYFPGKDHLLLAVIADIIEESTEGFKKSAAKLRDPAERLRVYITTAVLLLRDSTPGPSFITAEHWRLQTLYPEEISQATRPFTNLILSEITAATEAGLIAPASPEYSAWLITQLTMAVFHHYDSAGLPEAPEEMADRLFAFCYSALGGTLDGTR